MRERRTKGFTLVELMIVIAIVAILVALAYPSWEESIKKARRADGIESLQSLRIKQKQWRANHVSYSTTLSDVSGATSTEGHYTIAFVGSPNATTFVAKATPTGAQSTDSCGTFAINQDGPLHSGDYANARCWNK